jgi:beta-lactamase class D
MARRIGRERMQDYLKAADYGNHLTGEKIHEFWLDGSLNISAHQQMGFLRRFAGGDHQGDSRSVGDLSRQALITVNPWDRRAGGGSTALIAGYIRQFSGPRPAPRNC